MPFWVITISDTTSIFGIGYMYWTEALPDPMPDESFTEFASIDIAEPRSPRMAEVNVN